MKHEATKKRYSLINIIIPLILGCVFIALGIGVLIALIISAVHSKANAAIIIPIILFVLLPVAFGLIPLIFSLKQVYHIIRDKKARISKVETTARITDSKKVSLNGRQNHRYALKLSYQLNGEKRLFTTDYVYDINEFRYLRSLTKIKINVDGKYVVITEDFPKEIYTVSPRYGIETSFFRQPTVKITLRIWAILCIIAIICFIASIFLSSALDNRVYFIAAAIALAAVNIPFAIVTAVFFIKWIVQIKK